jgi:hypothetical protein
MFRPCPKCELQGFLICNENVAQHIGTYEFLVKEIVVALKLDFHGMNILVKEIVAAKKHSKKIYVPRSHE